MRTLIAVMVALLLCSTTYAQDGESYAKYWAVKAVIKNIATKEVGTAICNPKVAVWFTADRITVYNRESWDFEVISGAGKYESPTEENFSFFVRTREETPTTIRIGKLLINGDWIMCMEIVKVKSSGVYYNVTYMFEKKP